MDIGVKKKGHSMERLYKGLRKGWWCIAVVKEAPGVWGDGEMGGWGDGGMGRWGDGGMGSVGEIKKYICSPLPCRTTEKRNI